MTQASGLLERLNSDEVLILDGAIGTELQRRGMKMNSNAWCALASQSDPDLLRQVHVDYINAGADIITTNTFATARHVLDAVKLGDATPVVNRSSVSLAQQAVEVAERNVLLGGAMSSMGPFDGSEATPRGRAVADSYQEQAEILAAAGVDLIMAEMMLDMTNAPLVIEAAKGVGLPLMVGWSASPDGSGGVAAYRGDVFDEYETAPFDELIAHGAELGGEVSGIMHSEINVTGPALEILKKHWNGPTMAYAETGHFDPPNWVFADRASPAEYAQTVLQWVDAGVRIVGGCCGTTPGHIAAISAALADRDGSA